MELDRIREHVSTRPRDLLLFELALQSEVPMQDLLRIRVKDVKRLEIGDHLPLHDAGGKIKGRLVVNKEVYHAILKYLKETKPHDYDYIFKSRKGNKAISIPSVSRIIRGWREETGLIHFNGLPSLRSAHRKDREQHVADNDIENEKYQKVLPRVKSLTIQEKVYMELQKAILAGRIPPGQKLVIEEISQMMGVSRIPVREAMGRLEARGIITTRTKLGTTVNELSRENLKEISELRLVLEPRAAVKASLSVDSDFLARLKQAHTAFASAREGTDTDQLLQTNREFHFLIYKQACSPMLLELIGRLWDKVSPYYYIMFRQSLLPPPSIGIDYHERILNGMIHSNSKEVENWLAADLTESAKFILNLFDIYKKNGKLK